MTRKSTSLLFIYDYFYPAFKAGGPVQSLLNLAESLCRDFDIYILCGSKDLHETSHLPGVRVNEWQDLTLPSGKLIVQVYYADKNQLTKKFYQELMIKLKPSFVYLNGIFSYRFFVIPLIALKSAPGKLVISPRGMLQFGALAGKAMKKKIYLQVLKCSNLLKKVNWHATNEVEAEDIRRVFGPGTKILVAGNIPKKPLDGFKPANKKTGRLRLVYISLISEKKNLLQVIDLVNSAGGDITLDVFGPIKDKRYGQLCLKRIAKGSGYVAYKDELLPERVQQTFEQYDASILLTMGENFGHALYECLGSGRPVFTSLFTPWNELSIKKAGWNLDISNQTQCLESLKTIVQMESSEFETYCQGAHRLAKDYYENCIDISQYKILFSI